MTQIQACVTFNNLTKDKAYLKEGMDFEKYKAKKQDKKRAKDIFKKHKLEVVSECPWSMTIVGDKSDYERLFGTVLCEKKMRNAKYASRPSVWFPDDKGGWNYDHPLKEIIDEAYIQWPFYYQNNRFPRKNHLFFPPLVDYHHLRVPGDVAATVNASRIHQKGIVGKGVRVLMLDSGFHFDHHHFQEYGYDVRRILGPLASDIENDPEGHGTAMAATLLAVAPGVALTGMKLVNENDDLLDTSLETAFKEALKLDPLPNIISLSLSSDLVDISDDDREHLNDLPGSLGGLVTHIKRAIALGITVVCAAGNGEVGFPAMMPEVISVGGVYVDEKGLMEASDYTSAFESKIYPNRHVPDLCGLSGMHRHSNRANKPRTEGGYIMLPVQQLEKLDRDRDSTKADDSWAIIGGSSTATAQVAGVCALLKEKNPHLTPADLKRLLISNARKVRIGHSNSRSNKGKVIKANRRNKPGASGAGLVDAFEAFEAVDNGNF
ncbi:MAG: S8 family serine peptidase [Cytophagales bacterium]|nr:S8 family serine peptidase [Cytophagales bacterium]